MFLNSNIYIIIGSWPFTFASTSGETSSSGDHNFPFFSPVDYRYSCKFKNWFKPCRKCREKQNSFGLSFLSYRRFFYDVTSLYKSLIEHSFIEPFCKYKAKQNSCSQTTNKENCKDLTKKENLTLSFIRRSFTMKFATTDFIGEANWSGANIEIWPRETNGVISCSGTSAFKLLLRGWGKKSMYILKLSCRYVNRLKHSLF